MATTKRANQADIAEKLGVSVSTVSRALANEAGISDTVRREVQKVARSLGYKSKHAPVTGNPDKRAVALVPLSGAMGSLASFYHGIVEGMRAQAAEDGIALDVRLVSEDQVTLDFIAKQVAKSDAAGVVLAGLDPSDDMVAWAAEHDIGVVLANGLDPRMRLSSVSPANFFGAYMAAQHLLDAGHRRILHYTFRNRPTILQRQRGFEAAMADHSDAVGTVICSNDVKTRQLLDDLLAGRHDVTAVFCWNDSVAVSMVETLMGPDTPLPPYFSIMGFDDLPIAGMANPRLSTVGVDREAIGRGVIHLLARRLDGDLTVQHLEIGLKLVPGETVFSLPAR